MISEDIIESNDAACDDVEYFNPEVTMSFLLVLWPLTIIEHILVSDFHTVASSAVPLNLSALVISEELKLSPVREIDTEAVVGKFLLNQLPI
jgi:hypothetical protein